MTEVNSIKGFQICVLDPSGSNVPKTGERRVDGRWGSRPFTLISTKGIFMFYVLGL